MASIVEFGRVDFSKWSERDKQIVHDKYVHPIDEAYAKQHNIHPIEAVIHRVAKVISDNATEAELAVAGVKTTEQFFNKLSRIMGERKAVFNSPVLFNVGIQEKPQCWACLILSVDDNMDSIVQWWSNETHCFLGGSGSGVNLSRIRGDGEPLSGGKGTASGPLSFERGADSIAGSIKSGGRTRRAAKMVVLDVDHPDIEEFIDAKSRVEKMRRVLASEGFDMSLNGKDSYLLQYQNANNSVRVTDEFMQAVLDDKDWHLTYRVSGQVSKTLKARQLFRQIAQAAWDCADPGMQFHDTVNRWHTTPSRGEIRSSNPCSEYMHIDDSVCNLASHNLMAYMEDGNFNVEEFGDVTRTMIAAMDIIVDISSYPNETIERNAKELRNLGLGTTNIGALLMSMGIPYDSEEGRSVSTLIHSLLMANAVRASAELAHYNEPHAAWEEDKEQHIEVLKSHMLEVRKFVEASAWVPYYGLLGDVWDKALQVAEANGQRNAQLTVIAPTGTISFWLGAETTGIEPVMAIHADKELVGGGFIDVSAQDCVKIGLEIVTGGTSNPDKNAELLRDHPVFQTAIGENALRPEAHLLMMAAVQPSISGAISKTINMPASASVVDVERIYSMAWLNGLKAVAIYRDNSKGDQPVRQRVQTQTPIIPTRAGGNEKMPYTRQSVTHKFTLDNQDFYVTAGFYPDGRVGEIFLKASAQGSFVAGMVDMYAIAISLGLQHGIEPSTFAEHFVHQSFEPHGVAISDSDIKFARSIVDYVWRWILGLNPQQQQQQQTQVYTNGYLEQCPQCHALALEWAGTCKVCKACGFDDGGCG